MRSVEAIDIPPVQWNLSHGRTPFHEEFPETVFRCHILWKLVCETNDRDRFGTSMTEACGGRLFMSIGEG